jgi:hypothetical protein
MFEGFHHRRALKRLEEKYWREIEPYHTAYDDALKQNKPSVETSELLKAATDRRKQNRDELTLLETRYLLSIASRHLLPIPEIKRDVLLGRGGVDPNWRISRYFEDYDLILSPDARRELELAIRAYRKERLETYRLWITSILTSLTGLIGVIVGLLAVILGRR